MTTNKYDSKDLVEPFGEIVGQNRRNGAGQGQVSVGSSGALAHKHQGDFAGGTGVGLFRLLGPKHRRPKRFVEI